MIRQHVGQINASVRTNSVMTLQCNKVLTRNEHMILMDSVWWHNTASNKVYKNMYFQSHLFIVVHLNWNSTTPLEHWFQLTVCLTTELFLFTTCRKPDRVHGDFLDMLMIPVCCRFLNSFSVFQLILVDTLRYRFFLHVLNAWLSTKTGRNPVKQNRCLAYSS